MTSFISLNTVRRVMNGAIDHLLRIVVDQTSDCVFVKDLSGRYTYANLATARTMMRLPEEVVGKTDAELLSPEAAERIRDDDLKVLNCGRDLGFEGMFLVFGEKRYFASTKGPVRNESGQIVGVFGIARDVTALRKAQQRMKEINEELEIKVRERTAALQESEFRLRRLIESNIIGLAIADMQGHVLEANDACLKMFGYSRQDLESGSIRWDLMTPPEYREQDNRIIEQLRQKGAAEPFEKVLFRKDGSRIPVCLGAAILNPDGEETICYLLDMSEQKAIEEKLRRSQVDLERRVEERTAELRSAKEAADQANRAKSAFLANMSHEIRTPLGVVLGFSELMLNYKHSRAERLEYVSAIKRNGQLLYNLINDILDLSKVEAGKLQIEHATFSLSEFLSDLRMGIDSVIDEKGIDFLITLGPDIPECIHTDPSRLKQVLNNLVGNAVKYTSFGKVELSIDRHATDPDLLLFTVRDTGRGIREQDFERIFEPFTQADSSTTKQYCGTGLGLPLSRQLARVLGGDVTLLDSRPGVGSTFRAVIRCCNASASPLPLGGPGVLPVGEYPLRGKRFLIVEDSRDNQALLGETLRLAGAQVEIAENGQQGVEKALLGEVDAVLMDIHMPGMDGFEATSELRKMGFQRPIIAVTARAMKEERDRCLKGGFDEHFGKPLNLGLLIEKLAMIA